MKENTMAASMVPLNIVNALVKAADFLEASGWIPTNAIQQLILEQFYVEKENLRLFKPAELRAWVDTIAENLNRILAEEGFSLRFDSFNPNEFGVLSILDVTVEWLVKAQPLPRFGREMVPGVSMDDFGDVGDERTALFKGFTSVLHPSPVACVQTKSGDLVYMTIAGVAWSGFELIEKIDAIRASEFRPEEFSKLLFPMIDFEEKKSLDWLVNLKTTGHPWEVADAAQQTKFKMNHTGARVKDAVTITVRSLVARVGPPPLIIDEPFFLWIERPGLGKPIFYAYLDQSVWKDPGSLNM